MTLDCIAVFCDTAGMNDLVLSLFPGIDLLGRGFEAEGFCIVRGPDLIWGGDVRGFHPPAKRFDGVVGGSPCQDFSVARRGLPPTGEGLELLGEYLRIVSESCPDWFLLENVPTVPDVSLAGYTVQRFDLNANECGSRQSRLRHFQFGSRRGLVVTPQRNRFTGLSQKICLATEGERPDRRGWADFCELQGLPRDFDLPGMSTAAKYRAVGNGVHVGVAQVIARAVRSARLPGDGERLCICGCGRLVSGDALSATAGCRKRLQRRRERDRSTVTGSGSVTLAMSQISVTELSL